MSYKLTHAAQAVHAWASPEVVVLVADDAQQITQAAVAVLAVLACVQHTAATLSCPMQCE